MTATTIIEYGDEYREAWDAYVAASDTATIAHRIGWRRVMSSTLGHRPRYMLAVADGHIRGVLPLFLVKTWWGSRQLISIPWIDYGGVVADDEDTARRLVDAAGDLARREKAGFVEFRSVHSGEFGLAPRTDKVTFLLELKADPEIIWKGFNAKLRNQIRKSQKCELTTEFTGSEGLDDFYRVFGRNMRDLGTPVWGRDFFAAILDEFTGSAELLLVKKDGRTVAGGLVLTFKDRAYVPSASSYREALKLCPNHALYWTVIERACRDGLTYFDFGRSSKDANTYRFKKQWAPEPTQLTWQYFLNGIDEVPHISPQNSKYRLFINVWRRLPLPLANFLGPKVIKNFP